LDDDGLHRIVNALLTELEAAAGIFGRSCAVSVDRLDATRVQSSAMLTRGTGSATAAFMLVTT
jgi:hypothetical protein